MTFTNPIEGGTVLEDTVVPEGEPWSVRLAAGDVLRLVDLEGQQLSLIHI